MHSWSTIKEEYVILVTTFGNLPVDVTVYSPVEPGLSKRSL